MTSKFDATPIKHQRTHKKKRFLSLISVILGLVAAYAVSQVIAIEVKGRRRVIKTTEQWDTLMLNHPYQRQDTDLRSPCPMLNTLANHGFIARDGRNIKSDDLFNALMLLGAPPTVTVGILSFVYSKLQQAQPHDAFMEQFHSLNTIDLDRLTVYKVLEHDVSLTRNDSALTPHGTSHVIPEYVERMIKLSQYENEGQEKGFFTRKNENDARKLRWIESARDNRFLSFGLFDQFASSTECSLLLDIIGRDGSISLPHLESFLMHEKIPGDWYPRQSTYSFFELATKPMICWHGARKSQASLNILNNLD